MGTSDHSGWQGRLGLSFIYAGLAVILSTTAVIALSLHQSPAQQNATTGIDILSYVLGFPLVTGWLVVVSVFGEWRSVHQGQIALVPFISIVIDSLSVFLVWEFLHGKKSKPLVSDDILHIN